MALPFNAAGGTGCISVTAYVAPALCAQFQAASLAGDGARAHELNERLFPLHQALFADASPAPVKYALSRVHGWLGEDVRLPLVTCRSEEHTSELQSLMRTSYAVFCLKKKKKKSNKTQQK